MSKQQKSFKTETKVENKCMTHLWLNDGHLKLKHGFYSKIIYFLPQTALSALNFSILVLLQPNQRATKLTNQFMYHTMGAFFSDECW